MRNCRNANLAPLAAKRRREVLRECALKRKPVAASAQNERFRCGSIVGQNLLLQLLEPLLLLEPWLLLLMLLLK